MSSTPLLGDTYTLMELPRTPDLALPEKIVVAEAQKEKRFSVTDTIDVGISKSIIASYVLKPTPKLVWSYPLSPSTLVVSMDVKNEDDGQLYVVGLTERKKSRLLLISKRGNETQATTELSLPHRATAVKFGARNSVYVLLQNGGFVLVQYTTGEMKMELSPKAGNVPSLASRGKVEFHAFIPKGSFNHNTDLLFYAVRAKNTDTLTYRLVGLNHQKSFEIYQISSQEPLASTHNAYTYTQGVLYVYEAAKKAISSRSLMKPQTTIKNVSVEALLGNTTPKSLVALVAVAADRLLLSHKSSVFLLNFQYESLLSEHTNNSGNHVYLDFALPVEGSSRDSASSFALYLNLEDKTKLCKLKSIQVDVGLNLLSECLGKAIKSRPTSQWNGVPHLADEDLPQTEESNREEMKKTFQKLAKAVRKKSTHNFDTLALSFLRQTIKHKPQCAFSLASDRIVDHKFVESVVALIFSLDEQKAVQIISEDFLPKNTLAYILTHPLFPVKFTRGLLVLLSALDEPELLKLAIQKCHAITLEELMTEFTNLTEVSAELDPENTDEVAFVAEFLGATIDRILHDHSLEQITKQLSAVLALEAETDSKLLERMLNVLINVNTSTSWTFVQAVIDVGGLFNWTVPTISALSEVIDSKVDALAQNSYNLTLANQAMIALEQNHQKKSKKSEPKVVDNIHEIANQRAQLDALLKMTNNTSNRWLLADEGIELAKKIPTYSKEKLVF